MPPRFFPKLSLLAATLAALVVASTAGATHGEPDFLPNGHDAFAPALSGTGLICNLNGGCLAADNGSGLSGAHGIVGRHTAGGNAAGVYGETLSTSTNAAGVIGRVASGAITGTSSAGVLGEHLYTGVGNPGYGVLGKHARFGTGVRGESNGGMGVSGYQAATTGTAAAVHGLSESTSTDANGIFGLVRGGASSTGVEGVNQANSASDAAGVRGTTVSSGTDSAGVRGANTSFGCCGMGIYGSHSGFGAGTYGTSEGGIGAVGIHLDTTGTAPGVKGSTPSTTDFASGVFGEATGSGTLAAGVYGSSGSGTGLLGLGGSYGLIGYSPGFAGYFIGNVHVQGTLSKSAGSFRIDHPLEPETKYLQHSFVESPDMKNVYDGIVRTDRRGFATVRLPRYFGALNRDFRYQLTIVGKQGWDVEARVWEEVARNRFVIRTNKARVKVSWQVTGIRKDRYANEHRIKPEVAKATADDPAALRRLTRRLR